MKHEKGAAAAASVVLADDHAVFLAGLKETLCARGGLDVVATASDGLEAMTAVKRHAPDVAVLDDAMPVATGLETFAEARRWSPRTKFVILTGMISPARMSEMMTLGVDAILLKTMEPGAIADAVEAVLRGETVLGSDVPRHLADAGDRFGLTAREFQVLEGIVRGESNVAMAEALGVSAKTVDTHRMHLMRKMNARNIANLLVNAIRHGLIDVT